MKSSRGNPVYEWLATLPSFLWLTTLFVIPTAMIFVMSFRPADPFGGIGTGWTLETWRSLAKPSYPIIVWRTLWLTLLTTVICLFWAIPVGYAMARAPKRWQQILLLLVIVPFWTSFLIRIFAWKIVLHPDGPIKKLLVLLRLVRPEQTLLYNSGAVLLVLVYSYLPFAILPIYAAAEKFDFQLLEAARDLGARPFRAFCSVFLPGIRRGLLTAILVVFIPTLGSYVIPDLVGGPSGEMIGNKIAQRTFVDRNLPHASALSALLTLAILLPLMVMLPLQKRKEVFTPPLEERA